MTIEMGMQTFNVHWHPKLEISQMGKHGIENRETRKIVMGTHTGTHVDAPRHFINKGLTIENVSLDILSGPANVVDFSKLSDFHEIQLSELEKEISDITIKRLICRFDWDAKALMTNKYYTDHPFFSEETCEWIVDNGFVLIGLDTPQPDDPKNGYGSVKDAPNHRILLGGDVLIVEYLVNLRKISKKVVDLVVAPLKIKDGDGAPARCFVIE